MDQAIPMSTAQVADVPGASFVDVIDEQLPCGIGRATRWRAPDGTVLRQDYTVFVKEGLLAGVEAGQL